MNYSIRYHYERGGDSPLTNPNGTLSNHHVLSYPHMYALGVIVLATAVADTDFRNRCSDVLARYYGGNGMRLTSEKLPDLTGNKISFVGKKGQIGPILKQIAWTHDNLFVGPSGKYRDDDPSQRTDGIPISVGRWDFPNTMQTLFREIKSYVANEKDQIGTINIEEHKMKRIAEGFIKALPLRAQAMPKQSRVSDWVVQITKCNGGRTEPGYFPVFFPKSAEKKFYLRSEMDENDLYCGRFSLKKRGMRVNTDKRFRVLARAIQGEKLSLFGRIVNAESEHSGQDYEFISKFFPKVPKKYKEGDKE